MEIKRRDFLRLGLAAGATVALGGPTLNAFANGKDTREGSGGTEPGQWIPTTCQGCTAWCPAEFFVQNGRAVKVRGNHLCKANNGYVCPRGHLMLQELYDPDRIKVPMKRTNPQKGRGIDPKFVPFYTEGYWGYRDYDLARTKYLLIWGCDPLSSNRQVPITINKFSDILDRGTIAAVDPRLTASAAKAQEWLPVKP